MARKFGLAESFSSLVCTSCQLHFANVEFFFFRAFPTSWVGLYFRGSRLRYARRPPPKTAPQRRPKGSLSLTRFSPNHLLYSPKNIFHFDFLFVKWVPFFFIIFNKSLTPTSYFKKSSIFDSFIQSCPSPTLPRCCFSE